MNWFIASVVVAGIIFWFHRQGKKIIEGEAPAVAPGAVPGKVEKNVVKAALESGELDELTAATAEKASAIDRHMLLERIAELSYKRRAESKMKTILLKFGRMHLDEFPDLWPALETEAGEKPNYVATFKLLAMAFEEDGRYDDAIRVCEMALEYDLDDGTKTGFEGRIGRLRKKQDSEAHSE